jgi:hypothetical protein
MFDSSDPGLAEAQRLVDQAVTLDEAAALVTTHGTTVAASAALMALAEHRRTRSRKLHKQSLDQMNERFRQMFETMNKPMPLPPSLQLDVRPASAAWRATGSARQAARDHRPVRWWRRAGRVLWWPFKWAGQVFLGIVDGLR